jgi:chemotaxis protein CheX
MATATLEAPSMSFRADPHLLQTLQESVASALTMCDTQARCVGISTVPSHEPGIVTGLIGVHGKVSGFVTVNMAERVALKAVGGLLQDNYDKLTAQVVDGVGEITNLIVGGIKGGLSTTPWSFSHITVPSVIVGKGYKIAYVRGLEFLCAVFEHNDPDALMLNDRLLQVSVSLLRL